MRCRIFLSESVQPHFNLALEEWLFHDLTDVDQVLFLWRNAPTVVIGRSQNPWAECHLEKMQAAGVHLARRQSGGGTVYHDLGNTNFTFLSRKPHYDKTRNLQLVIDALALCGVKAYASGRNDLLVDLDQPRKVSGSAFKEKADRAFHHGTLLINADLQQLAEYLNPSRKKLEAKGVTSVRSRVANLIDVNAGMDHEGLVAALVRVFCQCYAVGEHVSVVDANRMANIPAFVRRMQAMQSWDWLYGQTLAFTHRFEHKFAWGLVEVQLKVDKGYIEEARIYTDALMPEWLEALALTWRGQAYAVAALCQSLAVMRCRYPEQLEAIIQFSDWVLAELK